MNPSAPTTSTPLKKRRSGSNPLSQYMPDCNSLEIAMERYCRLHWSSGSSAGRISSIGGTSNRRSSSEPISSLVDSGRSSLTSYGSEESLSADEFEVFSDCYSDYEDEDDQADFSLRRFDHLWEEWKIPLKDLTLYRSHQTIDSKTNQIRMSGYWHGAVSVYQRSLKHSEDKRDFVTEVKSLCKIRHENIQLFMGVCIDMPENDVAIVMSELKGEPLHSHLSKYGHRFAKPNRLRILKQIAEGMEYLHAKGISHGSLTSSIITYQHRVCISMSLTNKRTRTLDSTDITYLPAKDVQKIRIDTKQHQLTLSAQPSFVSDVFAYGTIAYELMTLERPYRHCTSLVELIWTIGNEWYQPLDSIPKGRFRSIISKCWFTHSTKRPSFKKIISLLQDDSQILGKYSSISFHNYSVPSHLCSYNAAMN